MKKVVSFLIFFSIIPSISYSKNHLIYDSIDKEHLLDFNKTFKKICSTEVFFKNLVSHESYPKFGSKKEWKDICKKIDEKKIDENHLIKKNFQVKNLSSVYGKLTGYYEPKINVSKTRTSSYSIPILKFNKKFQRVRRGSIQKIYNNDDVLLWTDDLIDFFFLQIQGSGIGVFSNGESIKILYDGNNNLKYTSIGKVLIKKNILDKKNVNLFSIKKFLRQNPIIVDNILNENHRYIFFKLKSNDENPIGAFGISLIPNVSIAVDKKYYPLGIPLLYKDVESENYKPSFALDTGSAILGRIELTFLLEEVRSQRELLGC